MAAQFRVMTAADDSYFHFLPFFEANVARKFGQLPLIYDLGMTSEQRSMLKSEIFRVPVPAGYKNQEEIHGFVMATHKPACIADALSRYAAGCLYADADVMFAGPINEQDLGAADVAVTPRHRTERKPVHFKNGNINSGVVYFSGTHEARRLVTAWAEACARGDRTDQQALSDLLKDFELLHGFGPVTRNNLTVMRLDPHIFNDVRARNGRVLHFKKAGYEQHILARLERYRRFEERYPRTLTTWLAVRRLLRI